MIIGVFGLPGEGKTTMLTKCAWRCLHGKSFMGIPPHSKVYTNFACPGCYQLDFDTLGLYDYHDCLILIDEIMLFADCRDFKNFTPELKWFFALHRHQNIDILWCSQYYNDCDKKIRNLTAKFFLLEKSNVLPFSYVKPIIRAMGCKDNQMVDSYTLGAPITWNFVFRPRYYHLFDSYEVDKQLPPVAAPLWSDLPDPVPLHVRLTDWGSSPVLRLCRDLVAWDRSPILQKLELLRHRHRLRIMKKMWKNCKESAAAAEQPEPVAAAAQHD